MTDLCISPEIGARLRAQREWVGVTPESAAAMMRQRGFVEFRDGAAVIEFEEGNVMSYMSTLVQFARFYGCTPGHFLNPDEYEKTPVSADLAERIEGLTENDRQHVLRFHDFLHHAGPAPEVRRDRSE